MFGRGPARPDDRDRLIASLESERDYLRSQVEILQKENLAMRDPHAFHQVHTVEPAKRDPQIADPPKPHPVWSRGAQVHQNKINMTQLEMAVLQAQGRVAITKPTKED